VDLWFGIPTMWIPYAAIGTDHELRYADIYGGDSEL